MNREPTPAAFLHQVLAVLAAVAVLAAFPLRAQEFGKNRLVVRDYSYKIWETEHFLIHYYEENPLLLEECAKYLEEAWTEVTGLMQAKPDGKLPFFLYTNHNEFEQTRVVDIGEGTGGVTEALKNRLLIFNNGSFSWLRHVIYHEFTHEVEFAILHRGFWKSARLLKSILYPLWLMEGMAEYASGEIDRPTDLMYARDAAASRVAPPFSIRDLHNFNHLKPNQITRAYKQGSFMVEFVAEEYGKEKLSAMFRSFRDRFDINSVLLDVLGLDDERFDRNFKEWLEEKYGEPAKLLDKPFRYGTKLTFSEDPIPVFHYSPGLSSDGRSLFSITLRQGYPAIYEQDLVSGKRTIVVGRSFRELDWINLDGRNLSLSSDGRYLYFIGKKDQEDYLCRYDRTRRRIERRKVQNFTTLRNPAVNPKNFNEVVLAAMDHGFNDVYLVDFVLGKATERITSDPQDDDEPAFLGDGSGVVYTSEVGLSSQGFTNRDLYVWRREGKIAQLLTRGPKVEKSPAVSSDGLRVAFLSDQEGSWDLYEMDLASGAVERRTRVATAILSPSYAGGDTAFLYSSLRDGEVQVYRGPREKFLAEDKTSIFYASDRSLPASKEEEIQPLSYVGPYRTRFGSDLFFPAFFYSTQGGLFALAYWQGSDMLGYHNVVTNLALNSGIGLFDYSVSYGFVRYRPELRFAFKGSSYRDILTVSTLGEDLRRSENFQSMIVSYPFDRHHRLEGETGLAERYQVFPSDDAPLLNIQEWRLGAQFVRDTTTAPYLVVTRGSRLAIGARMGLPRAKADFDYQTHFAEWHQFVPLGGDSTVAFRTSLAKSFGPDYEVFPLSGQGGVRGYPRESSLNQKRNIFLNNIELRFPLFGDLNYHMWYMFPDFYFKNIYLGIFSDQGARWDGSAREFLSRSRAARKDDVMHSFGLSLKLNTFILETFPFFFSFEWAKKTTASGGIFYGSVFQYFTFQ